MSVISFVLILCLFASCQKKAAKAELEETPEMFETHLISFPYYTWTIEEIFAAKDWVIARISSAGTFARDYYAIAATGNMVQSSTIIMARIENGKIVEERKEMDVLNVMQQFGIELKPKEEKN